MAVKSPRVKASREADVSFIQEALERFMESRKTRDLLELFKECIIILCLPHACSTEVASTFNATTVEPTMVVPLVEITIAIACVKANRCHPQLHVCCSCSPALLAGHVSRHLVEIGTEDCPPRWVGRFCGRLGFQGSSIRYVLFIVCVVRHASTNV